MKLLNYKYSEFDNLSKSWEMDRIDLQNVNLIVGKNGSGKTRVLNVIEALSILILNPNNSLYLSGTFDANFSNDADTFHLFVKIEEQKVIKEFLEINGNNVLDRNSDGKGTIKNYSNDSLTNFDIPNEELFLKRRDKLQYPFLQELYNWAISLVKFRFTYELPKQSLMLIESNLPPYQYDLKDTTKTGYILAEGIRKYRDEFKNKIINNFTSIGFPISDITLQELITFTPTANVPGRVVGLHVKETDREGTTDQTSMSDGMFRALTVIIHFAYFEFEHNAGCILIDDIGEGLDFERSVNLIKLLISNAEASNVQLIMSSNDRMVMNNTKLEYWQIISRTGNHVKFFNKENSAEIFKDFEFTGLNNFDFFTTEFYKLGFSDSKKN